MNLEEYIEELHRFRRQRSKEFADLTPEERCEKINERGQQLAKKYGLKMKKCEPKKAVEVG